MQSALLCLVRCGLALSVLSGLLSGCGRGSSNAAKFNDVALGDSAAYGRGGTDDIGYIHYFRDYLKTVQPKEVVLDKQALLGIRSGDLLFQLEKDVPKGARSAVRGASLLTLSIGGNNLLQCGSDNYTKLDPVCAAKGVTDFQNDWPKILQQIRASIGSRAPLYVTTLYNPYKGDDPLFATVDAYVRQVNAVIQNPAMQAAYNYKVADVYADFSGKLPDGTWKVCSWTHFCEATHDVHPTDAGHKEIAKLHQSLYP